MAFAPQNAAPHANGLSYISVQVDIHAHSMSEHISDTNPTQSKRATLQNRTTASLAQLPGRHTASTSLAHITPAERLGSLNALILP